MPCDYTLEIICAEDEEIQFLTLYLKDRVESCYLGTLFAGKKEKFLL